MNHKIRLGPIAVFLAVIAVVLSMLAVLTTATTHADQVLADRYAKVTALRYALEKEGSLFLKSFDSQVQRGEMDPAAIGAAMTEDGYTCRIEKDGYTLTISLSEPDAAGSYEITEWKIRKQWEETNPMEDLWRGNGL